jgi:ABC-type branched-subunit amino acid transport system ATPase component
LIGSDPGLNVTDLHVAYDRDIEIVRGVQLTAASARITAIIGPNGAGKSTLLRAIAGIAPVVGGRVTFAGEDVTGLNPGSLLQRGLVFVPQDRTTFGEMTVYENLQMGGWLHRRQRSWLRQRVDEIFDLFPMLRVRRKEAAGDLSGGQQRILEIARSLISRPTALLLDEPTAGLSPTMALEVYERIRDLRDVAGVTILLVDQNIREALTLCDRAYVIAMGRNDAEGSGSEVLGRLDEIVRGWMARRGSGLT